MSLVISRSVRLYLSRYQLLIESTSRECAAKASLRLAASRFTSLAFLLRLGALKCECVSCCDGISVCIFGAHRNKRPFPFSLQPRARTQSPYQMIAASIALVHCKEWAGSESASCTQVARQSLCRLDHQLLLLSNSHFYSYTTKTKIIVDRSRELVIL